MVTRESTQFSVLYTHQKTKKAKTWQDGILKVINGNKALLYDEQSKTLDTVFVHGDQVAPGEELESDRYLITIEQRLPSDLNPEVCLSLQQEELNTSGTQSRKRKRGDFRPPHFCCQELIRTGGDETVKETREERTIPRKRLGISKKPLNRQDFFNVYSRGTKAQDGMWQSVSRPALHDRAPKVLQVPYKELPTNSEWEQRDQRVPFVSAGGISADCKENRFTDPRSSSVLHRNGSDNSDCSPEGKRYTSQIQLWNTQLPSKASSVPCRNVNGCPDSKRDTAQILALFSSKKNMDPKLVSEESVDEQGQWVAEENRSLNLSGKETINTCVQSKIIPGCKSKSDIKSTDSNVAEAGQDLFDSFNLSPDSFAASSNEEKATELFHQSSQDHVSYPEGDSVGPLNVDDPGHIEDSTQESSFVEAPFNVDSPTEGWSQNDSESVSPLLRQLGSVENRASAGDLCEFRDIATDSSALDNLSLALHPESCTGTQTDTVLHPVAQQFNLGLGHQASLHRDDLNSVNSLHWKQNVFMTQNIQSGLITDGKDVHMEQKKVQDNKDMKEWSIGKQAFSSHPGSLFEYSALKNQAVEGDPRQPCQSIAKKNCSSWHMPTEGRLRYNREGNDLQNDFSPEFYPSEISRASEWTVSTTMATKVISNDNRTVKAGDGHSWKGSVVSDTVKRDCTAVPTISVRRQELSTPTNDGYQSPTQGLSWISMDSVSSGNVVSGQLTPQHFATSESIAFSSTEGYMPSSQTTGRLFNGGAEFVQSQRVPQMARRRAPVLTGPSEDSDGEECKDPPKGDIHVANAETFSTDVPEIQVAVSAEASLPVAPLRLHDGNGFGTLSQNVTVQHQTVPRSWLLGEPCMMTKGCTLGRTRQQNVSSRLRKQLHNRSDVYQPPTTPVFMANSTSGDDSVLLLHSLSSAENNLISVLDKSSLKSSKDFQSLSPNQRSMAGELFFPSAENCDSTVTPTRQVTVPVAFENVMQYRQVFKAALREHLNIVLFELARTYHSVLQKVDVSGFSAHQRGSYPNPDGPCCLHGQARLRAVKKDGANKGRLFYTCPATGQSQCKFFKWADEYRANKSDSSVVEHSFVSKLVLSSSDSLMAFFRSHSLAFYCECHLIRKQSETCAKKSRWGRKTFGGREESGKKRLYLELSRKESSSAYSKDDIWIVCKNFSFNQESTFIASSVYYGPSSSGELEIAPISGYSPSNWQSGETVHALMACNAGTELTCISNIEEHVKTHSLPVLPHLLNSISHTTESNPRNSSRTSSFVPPMIRTSHSGQLTLSWEVVESLAEEMIARHHLNKDQAAALHSCAKMFQSSMADDSTSRPVCLIHGVFGAGKSFLLAVVVIFLVEVFAANDSLNQQSNAQSPWRILVSSTTNVAVDRILLGLLELGFEEFVRVGSVRKIAKPVLPYSVHSAGSDSQELRELQALLKGQLTPSERAYVRKSIERHRLGENRKRLSQVRVVGVTCAACVFPCLDKLKFPVLLLDECSQMTEPTSLLPMARFECQKLVLVGDPKQLSPTIQGSEPEHEAGLEQTLFDRLIKMGHEPTLLRIQYRCHPAISAISNRLFYDMKLNDGVTEEDRCPVVDIVPTLCFYNVAKGKEKCGDDGSYYNEEEAKFVVFLIKCLLEFGLEPTQIGVITLYKSQLRTISNNLTCSRATSHSNLKSIQISTVDAFQGGEKDLIVLSCVRTDHVGFIDCDRRTNVALTRAKRHLLIVGNLKMLSCNSIWGRVIEQCQNSPDGLCNASEFTEKFNRKKGGSEEVSSRGPDTADRSSGKAFETTPLLPSPTTSRCTDGAVTPNGGQCTSFPCKDTTGAVITTEQVPRGYLSPSSAIVDVSGAIQEDDDDDDDLPTFDLVSAIGI